MEGLGDLTLGSEARANATPEERARYDRAGLISAVDRIASTIGGVATDLVSTASEPIESNYLKTFIFGDGGEGAKTGTNPSTTREIVEGNRAGANPPASQYTASAPTNQETIDATPGFSSQEAAAAAAPGFVAKTQQPGRPDPEDVFTAMMYAKAGLITMPELMRYKQTGQLSAAPTGKVQSLGNGKLYAYYDNDVFGGQVIDAGGGAAGQASIAEQSAAFSMYQKVLPEEAFYDDPASQSRAIEGIFGALGMHGIDTSTEEGLQRAVQPRIRNAVTAGMGFIQRFNPDTAQNLLEGTGDFNPWPGSDPEFPLSSGSVALGTQAALDGIVSQADADEYLLAYGKILQANRGMTGEELVATAKANEGYGPRGKEDPRTVRGRLDIAANPDHPLYEEFKHLRGNRNKARRELAEEIIENQ